MPLTTCLTKALDAKLITQQQHDRLAADFERFRSRYGLDSASTASERARQTLLDQLKAERAHATRRAQLDLVTTRRLLRDLEAHRTPHGDRDVAQAALFKLDNNGEAQFDSVSRRHDVIVGLAHARMESLMVRFRRSRLAGDLVRHNRAQLDNVVREAFGEDSGDVMAKEFARIWGDTAEWLRRRFNAAGGAIGQLENWGLPQWHDPLALVHTGLEAWKQAIRPLLDVGRMQHPLTQTPILSTELDDILEGIWHGVVTDGWDTREARRQVHGRGALANQRMAHRFLVFKDADAWLQYQRDFGGGADPFATMMGHINMMGRDIASMEILGTNPALGVEFLKQVVTKAGMEKRAGRKAPFAGRGDPVDRARRYADRIDAVWGSIRGTLNTPVSGLWANVGAGIRNFITASVLGSAAPASITDVGTQQLTRALAGMNPTTGAGVFAQTIRAAIGGATQREAIAAGLILDQARHIHNQQARYVGTLGGPEWVRWLGDRVITLSGLSPWTQGGRHAFGLAFMHEIARQQARPWSGLNPLLRSRLAGYGFTEGNWDTISRTAIHKATGGLELVRPNEIAARDPGLAERYLGMILSETEYAIPSGTHRSRTILINQNQPGTVPGEILRSFAQFKSFGAVYAMLHGRRIAQLLAGKETRGLGAAYAGALLLTSTLYGALALQFKQVSAGRDARPMDSPAFWGAALLQGGGLGIYGDFFFSNLNRYGSGIASNIGGPMFERLGDFANLTVGNLVQLATGQKTDFGRELIQFARGNVPGGNIWYLRLGWERLVLDQLQYLADPEANRSFKAQQQRWKREFGQGYWWAPGTPAPQRPPALGAPSP